MDEQGRGTPLAGKLLRKETSLRIPGLQGNDEDLASSSFYFHVVDDATHELIMSLQSAAGGSSKKSMGSVSEAMTWSVSVPADFFQSSSYRKVALIMTDEPHTTPGDHHASKSEQHNTFRHRREKRSISSDSRSVNVLAISNTFIIQKTFTITQLEYAYACFCRAHHLVMEPISTKFLHAHGISTQVMNIKVVKDFHTPLPGHTTTITHHSRRSSLFENAQIVFTPGQHIVSSSSLMATLLDDTWKGAHGDQHGAPVRGLPEVTRGHTDANVPFEGRIDIFK